MGYFAIRAQWSPAGMTALRQMSAMVLRAKLNEAAEQLGGQVVDLFFLASSLAIVAIFDLPSKGSSSILLHLLSSGSFEPGATMVRIETSEELDAALGHGTALAASETQA